MNDWEDLDTLCREIEEANAEWVVQRDRFTAGLAAVQEALERVEQAQRELTPDLLLDNVRTRLLGGVGMVQRLTLDFALERLTALTWPAAADPRPDLAGAAGEYRVEVWLGLNERQRPRVLIVGAKRMEALLPVPVERFRSVLLGAVRAPALIARDGAMAADGATTEQATPSEAADASPAAQPASAPTASDEGVPAAESPERG